MPQVRYTRDHEWVRMQGGLATIGLTRLALDTLGGAVRVCLPRVGERVHAGQACAAIEAAKAASDASAPLGGTVAAVNAELLESPALLNQDPYGAGWLYRIRPDDPAGFEGLLDQGAYDALVGSL